jgi:hypothetical protein
MEFTTDNAKMWLDVETKTVFLKGIFRLTTEQYENMTKILNEALAATPTGLTVDLKGLELLNSSGINVIAKFVIGVRNAKGTDLTIRGSKGIPWQGKSLPNLKKLCPTLSLVID